MCLCAYVYVVYVCVRACTCVCMHTCTRVHPKVMISGMIWTSYVWLNYVYSFFMTTAVSICSRCGLRYKTCHENQPNKNKLPQYKALLSQ